MYSDMLFSLPPLALLNHLRETLRHSSRIDILAQEDQKNPGAVIREIAHGHNHRISPQPAVRGLYSQLPYLMCVLCFWVVPCSHYHYHYHYRYQNQISLHYILYNALMLNTYFVLICPDMCSVSPCLTILWKCLLRWLLTDPLWTLHCGMESF